MGGGGGGVGGWGGRTGATPTHPAPLLLVPQYRMHHQFSKSGARHVFNVYETVKHLRLFRPLFLQTLEQFDFCYRYGVNGEGGKARDAAPPPPPSVQSPISRSPMAPRCTPPPVPPPPFAQSLPPPTAGGGGAPFSQLGTTGRPPLPPPPPLKYWAKFSSGPLADQNANWIRPTIFFGASNNSAPQEVGGGWVGGGGGGGGWT